MGKRIKAAIKDAKLTQEEVADHFGLAKQTVNHWCLGRSQIPLRELLALSKIVNVDPALLLTGRHPLDTQAPSNDNKVAQRRFVPMATKDEILALVSKKLSLSGVRDRRQSYTPCSSKSLSFEIPDKSMEPDFTQGSIVTVDKGVEPQPGDCVAVVLRRSNKILFRRFRPIGASMEWAAPYRLAAANPNFDVIEVTAKDDPVVLGTMVEYLQIRRS